MKRILYFKNHHGIMLFLWGLFFTASSLTFGPVGNVALADNSPQKKVQRLKVLVNKDGKTTTIDTTFNLADEKAVQVKVDSILKKVQIVGKGDGKSIVHMRNGAKVVKMSKSSGNNSTGGQQFDIFISGDDSTGKSDEKRIIYFGDNGKMEFSGDIDPNGLVPPPPPPPPPLAQPTPLQNYGNFHFGVDPFSFDTKDESIISYEKKDIGKGLEKITIIRKKRVEKEINKDVEVKVEVSDDQKK